MHIVFMDFFIHWGGSGQVEANLAQRLGAHEQVSLVDVYGVCSEFRQAAEAAGLGFHVLMPESGRLAVGGTGSVVRRAAAVLRSVPELLRIRKRAAEVLEDIRPDVVVCSNHKTMAMMVGSRRVRRVPLVAYVQGWAFPPTVPAYVRWMLRRRCAGLLAVSNATRTSLICMGIDHSKVFLLQNQVDADAVAAASRAPLAGDLPQADRPFRVLVPASLLRTKGQHIAIRAIRRLLDRGVDAALWLAGEVPTGGGTSYVSECGQLARRLGVEDRVCWLGWRKDVPQLMAAATVVALPTHTEGMPLVLLEAMALGRPIAAPIVGGIGDLILPGVTGLTFDVEDDVGLADCLLEFARDPRGASRMADQAGRYVRERFTPQRHTETALRALRAIHAAVRQGRNAAAPGEPPV